MFFHSNSASQDPSSLLPNSIFVSHPFLTLKTWVPKRRCRLTILFMLPAVHKRVPVSNTSAVTSGTSKKGSQFPVVLFNYYKIHTRVYNPSTLVQSYLNLFFLFFLRMLNSYILFLLSKYGAILFCFFIVLFTNASDVCRINHSLKGWKVLLANTFTHVLKWARLKHWLVTTVALSRNREKTMGITLIN